MNQTFNTSGVKAIDSDPPVEFAQLEQMLVILGFLLCVTVLLCCILAGQEKKSHLRRQRSGKIRVIPRL